MSNTVLLHDASRGQWLSFRRPAQVLAAHAVEEVVPALRQAEALVEARGLYAAGFISYEAAPAFDPSFRVRPGTLRAHLLDQGEIAEQVIRLDQLLGCELYRINALRGWERAQLQAD